MKLSRINAVFAAALLGTLSGCCLLKDCPADAKKATDKQPVAAPAAKPAAKPAAVKKETKPAAVKKATKPAAKPAVKKAAKPAAKKAVVKKAAKPAVKKAVVKKAAKPAAKPAAVKKATIPAAVKKATKPAAAVKQTKAAAKPAVKKPAAPRKAKPQTLEQAIKTATTPVQHMRHVKRHEAKKAYAAANKGKIKILMLGDSITHQWEYKPAAEAQKKYITPYNVLNLGCGGDRTQHTLWIIEKSGILDMISPKLVTIMIGTNNRGQYKSTVAGIKNIIDAVSKKYPDAQILLYAIFPRGKDNKDIRRIENEKVNAEIVKFCDGKKVVWVDIRSKFLTPAGVLEKSVMPDLLHPKLAKSYAIWGESLKPYFEKFGK